MLSEPQIQRYARQILLRDVGGAGQELLGRARVRVSGDGPLFAAARTYLRAGGTEVDAVTDEAPWAQEAPLLEGLPRVELEVGTVGPSPVPPFVVVGTRGGVTELWSAGAEACPDCLRARLPEPLGPAELWGPGAVVAGGALALLVQRRLLGLAAPLEALAVASDGVVVRRELPRCAHRPPELAPAVLAAVLAHLRAALPEEGCGVLLDGDGGLRFLPFTNAQAVHHARDPAAFPRDARSAFTVDPAAWLAVLRDADARGEEVAALVHSHPDGPAHFSDEDRRQAAPDGIPLFPAMAHLVVAFDRGAPIQAVWALWRIGGFVEVDCPLADRKPS